MASAVVPLVAVAVGLAIAASLFQLAIGFVRPMPTPPPTYCPLHTSTEIQVPSPGPTGNNSLGAPFSYPDGSVVFIASASGCVPPYSYSYVFGDGYRSQEANVTHDYPGPGYYSGSLTIEDSVGHNAESYFCVNASGWPNLVVGSGDPAPACP